MELPEGLELRESPIDGLGVFATKNFPRNYFFGAFEGIEYKWSDYIKEFGKDYRYCYRNRRKNIIISARHQRNFITYINDGIHGTANGIVNVKLSKGGLWATKDITAGEELLLDYGRRYVWA